MLRTVDRLIVHATKIAHCLGKTAHLHCTDQMHPVMAPSLESAVGREAAGAQLHLEPIPVLMGTVLEVLTVTVPVTASET